MVETVNMNKHAGVDGVRSVAAQNLGETGEKGKVVSLKKDGSRKLTLDPDKSYKTVMKRTADTPIEAVKAAPGLSFNGEVDLDLASKIAALEAIEQKTKLICPACGAVSTELRLSCQNCGNYFDGHSGAADVRLAALSSTGGLSREEQEKLAQKSYLTRRFLAKVIDSVILLSLVACQYLIFFAVARSLTVIPSMAFLALNFFFWGMPCLTLMTLLGYHALFEASQVQASPGKLLMGLFVEDLNSQIVRSEAILFKSLVAYSPLVVALGVYAYFYHVRLQYGLSLDAPTSTVLALSALTCMVTYGLMHLIVGKEEKRRTVLDVMAGCRIKERSKQLPR